MTQYSLNTIDPQNYTILVVDDNHTNLRVIVNSLREFGFKLLMAKDGEMCLKITQARQPDLILLDVMMPQMDGWETCTRLKADDTTRHIPVIFMTALTSEDDKVKGFEIGAVDYITKPIQQREVLARVNTHLRIQALTQTLQQKNEELAALNASKDKFFSIVAHDLKGPFLPLLGNLELLSDMADKIEPTEIKKMASSSHWAAKRTFELLEDLLQWARMQMGRMEYNPEVLELHNIVLQAIEVLLQTADAKRIHLQSEVEAGITVYADENMLTTIIRNLTNNALKFTPEEGSVTIRAQPYQTDNMDDREFIQIAVVDTGIGIDQEAQEKLFKVGSQYSTKGTKNEAGTGLGLLMCKEMIEMNEGQIWLESQLGQGTTVYLTVPLVTEGTPIKV